ncbi:hypothetical protein BIW11_09182, partial [Tropilaelaps mercedesae]
VVCVHVCVYICVTNFASHRRGTEAVRRIAMRSGQSVPWAHRPGVLVAVAATLLALASAAPASDDTIMNSGRFGRADLFALFNSVPVRRFEEVGSTRNGSFEPHMRHVQSRETKREPQIIRPPSWFPYQTAQELRTELAGGRPQSDSYPETIEIIRQANLYPSCKYCALELAFISSSARR